MTEHTSPEDTGVNPVIQFVNDRMKELGGVVTEASIAAVLGVRHTASVQLFLKGELKLPLNKVAPLARLLDVDPVYLTCLALRQFWPNDNDDLDQMFGAVMSANERTLVEVYREASGDTDKRLPPAVLDKIRKVIVEASA